jgi:hypothetical protein
MEFKSFDKISKYSPLKMTITQKIHGSNAQIVITPIYVEGIVEPVSYDVQAGSRNRWIYPGDDNFGFAAYVEANKAEIVEKLGPGTHFGEWAGPGINSGEGLTEKTFIIFNHKRFPVLRPLPPQMKTIPVLYEGHYSEGIIKQTAFDLKLKGSHLVSGFMRPEGMVIEISGQRYKYVFDPEETMWTKGDGRKVERPPDYDASHLLQPIRLEKLLSKDERYMRDYPSSLSQICTDYIVDLIEEGQIIGTDGEIKGIKKAASKQIFSFIKEFIGNK